MFKHRPLWQQYHQLLALALPIMAALLSQSLLNVVDAFMVGQLGAVSLAAVGVGGYLNFIAVSLLLGLGAAVQALVARAHSGGQKSTWASPMKAGLLLGLLSAAPITLFFYAISKPALLWISQDTAVTAEAVPYFLMRLAGLFAVAMNFSFRGYWNGIHKPSVFLKILVLSHLLNVLFSYVLIYGHFGFPALGSTGAGMGTTLAMCCGMMLNAFYVWNNIKPHGEAVKAPAKPMYKAVSRIAIPTSLQQFSFALGMTLLFWLLAHFGSDYLAIGHVLISITLLLILPAMGIALAATTLVGHALGRNNTQEASRWGWLASRLGLVVLIMCTLPIVGYPEWFLQHFLHQDALVQQAKTPLRITALVVICDGLAMIFSQVLLSIGEAKKVFCASFCTQWLLFLPLAYVALTYFNLSFVQLWGLYGAQRLLNTLALIAFWRYQDWQKTYHHECVSHKA